MPTSRRRFTPLITPLLLAALLLPASFAMTTLTGCAGKSKKKVSTKTCTKPRAVQARVREDKVTAMGLTYKEAFDLLDKGIELYRIGPDNICLEDVRITHRGSPVRMGDIAYFLPPSMDGRRDPRVREWKIR